VSGVEGWRGWGGVGCMGQHMGKKKPGSKPWVLLAVVAVSVHAGPMGWLGLQYRGRWVYVGGREKPYPRAYTAPGLHNHNHDGQSAPTSIVSVAAAASAHSGSVPPRRTVLVLNSPRAVVSPEAGPFSTLRDTKGFCLCPTSSMEGSPEPATTCTHPPPTHPHTHAHELHIG
jgi:hypothetical protein